MEAVRGMVWIFSGIAQCFGLLVCVTIVIVTAMSYSGYINSSSSIYSVVKDMEVV